MWEDKHRIMDYVTYSSTVVLRAFGRILIRKYPFILNIPGIHKWWSLLLLQITFAIWAFIKACNGLSTKTNRTIFNLIL